MRMFNDDKECSKRIVRRKMKQRVIYLLKHNPFAQKAYRVIGSGLLRLLGLFVRTDPNLVIFISLMGTRYNDSPRDIYEYMLNHDEYKKFKLVWAFENPKDYPDIPSVKIDTLPFFVYALKAGYWISSTQFERGLTYKKKNTKYMYTMHGAAIKLSGNDCPGRHDFDYRTVDYLCVESDFDKYVFNRSFNAPKGCFLESGRPCNDPLWHATEEQKNELRTKLEIPQNKKVIFYAPTWRDSNNGGKTYDIKPPIDFDLWRRELADKYVILFRAHHITTRVMDVKFDDFIRDYSSYPEINDLYIVSDMLITDYSSVMVDFAILERPIFCFAYDYDDYLVERGTYFDLNKELPNGVCRSQQDLLSQIKRVDFAEQSKKTKAFKDKYDQFGGNGVKIAVETLFG